MSGPVWQAHFLSEKITVVKFPLRGKLWAEQARRKQMGPSTENWQNVEESETCIYYLPPNLKSAF